jgi:hypothetical protein
MVFSQRHEFKGHFPFGFVAAVWLGRAKVDVVNRGISGASWLMMAASTQHFNLII